MAGGPDERGAFEDLVRASLRARARDVTPDPRTWRRVQMKLRRARTLQWLSGATAVAAVAVVAVAALPGVLGRRVQFEAGDGATAPPAATASPGAPGSEAPSATEASPAPLGERLFVCGRAEQLALAFVVPTGSRDLLATCADLDRPAIADDPDRDESEPAFAPDGTQLAYTRRSGRGAAGNGEIVLLDLVSGDEQVVAEGYAPAFAPDGGFAYLRDTPGDGEQPQVVVRDSIDAAESERSFAVFTEGTEEFGARHLVWDPAGGRLWWEAGYEGATLWTADLAQDPPTPLQVVTDDQDVRLVAPAPAPGIGGVTAVSLSGGSEFGLVELSGAGTEGGELARFRPIVRLDETGIRPERPLYNAAGGQLSVTGRDGDLTYGRARATATWVLGDGRQTLAVELEGTITDLVAEWHGAAVHPSFVGSSEPREAAIDVFFSPAGGECGATTAVGRRARLPAVAEQAVREVLAGPRAEEVARGLRSPFSAATAEALNGIVLDAGIVTVDLSGDLVAVLGQPDACERMQLVAQIERSLSALPTVGEVRLALDGSTDAFKRWLAGTP